MFERELRDLSFITRWSIVRTNRDQNISDHSFYVAIYTNDICHILGLPPEIHLAALQYALWHDVDEIFTGDMPGPNKRRLLSITDYAIENWKAKIREWTSSIFGMWNIRSGGHTAHTNQSSKVVKAVVKVADWMDAAIFMAGEAQMGNRVAATHVPFDSGYALQAADHLCDLLDIEHVMEADSPRFILTEAIRDAVTKAGYGRSRAPKIAGEPTPTSGVRMKDYE